MFKFRKVLVAVIAFAATGWAAAQAAEKYPGIGRAATPAEVKAWDIDVRPDFQGLPAGSGTVAKGQDVWEGKCAHCHGVFGESKKSLIKHFFEATSARQHGRTTQSLSCAFACNVRRKWWAA